MRPIINASNTLWLIIFNNFFLNLFEESNMYRLLPSKAVSSFLSATKMAAILFFRT
jgi:hypothetical protein